MKRLIKQSISELKFLLMDDWFIYAYDSNGQVYMTNTELWDEWDEWDKISKPEETYSKSAETYILPIAKQKWDKLSWEDTGKTVYNFFGNIDKKDLDKEFEKYNIQLLEG